MTKQHPLRPKSDSILICEGISDFEFINPLFNHFTPKIYVIYGNGNENLAKVAAIFQPASFYVRDRDFVFSVQDAQASYLSEKPRCIWTHSDLESYLIYSDWLWQAVQDLSTQHNAITKPPSSKQAIEAEIFAIAQNLIIEYAGRHTVEIIDQSLYLAKRGRFTVPPSIKTTSNQHDWEQGLMSQAQRLHNALQIAANNPDLANVLNIYHTHIQDYQSYARSLESIRLHFSGKHILHFLALSWEIKGKTKNKDKLEAWEILRRHLQDYALTYGKSLQQLSNDSRLGDFGRVASKITGQVI